VLFAAPFILFSIGFAGCTAAQLNVTREILSIPTSLDGPDGPRILLGTADVDSPTISPSGAPVALWSAELMSGSGKHHHRECAVQGSESLVLVMGDKRVSLAPLQKAASKEESGSPRVKIVNGDLTPNLPTTWPALMTERCPSAPKRASYLEYSIPVGTPLAVRACVVDGVIAPCADGHNQITTGGRLALRDEAGFNADTVAFGELWNSLVWTMLGFFALAVFAFSSSATSAPKVTT
jgi:hypothetical protein